jgi:hypothetical protein
MAHESEASARAESGRSTHLCELARQQPTVILNPVGAMALLQVLQQTQEAGNAALRVEEELVRCTSDSRALSAECEVGSMGVLAVRKHTSVRAMRAGKRALRWSAAADGHRFEALRVRIARADRIPSPPSAGRLRSRWPQPSC